MKDYPEDALEVKRGFESKKYSFSQQTIVQVRQANQNYMYSQTCRYKSHSGEHESQSN
jgi:hypothetical protein